MKKNLLKTLSVACLLSLTISCAFAATSKGNTATLGTDDPKPWRNVATLGTDDPKPWKSISPLGTDDPKPWTSISTFGTDDPKPWV